MGAGKLLDLLDENISLAVDQFLNLEVYYDTKTLPAVSLLNMI